MIDLGTVMRIVGAIKEVKVWTGQTNIEHPVPGALSPVRIGRVTGINRKTSRQIKEAAVGDGVLVVVPVVEAIDLPFQATIAALLVPSHDLSVEDSLGQGQPLRFIFWRIGVSYFGRGHDRNAPEGLVIVSQGAGLIGGHEIGLVTGLVQQGLSGDVVPFCIARVVPVFHQRPKHGTSLPPIIGVGQIAGHITWSVSGVIL